MSRAKSDKAKQLEKEVNEHLKERMLDDVRKVCATPCGRRFMHYLNRITGVYRSSMTGDNWTFYNEGRRSVGVDITDILMKADPTLPRQIEAEYWAEYISNKERLKKIDAQEGQA